MESTGLRVRGGVDHALHHDGYRSVAGSEARRFQESETPLGLFAIQLMLNVAWSWIFFHQYQPCSLEAVKEYSDDWKQAWTAAGQLWNEKDERLQFLTRETQRGEVFYGQSFCNEFASPVVRRLLDQGQMAAEEVRAVRDEAQAAGERRRSRPYQKAHFRSDEIDEF